MWLWAGAELMETLGHWARCLPRGLRDALGCARTLLVARWPQDALIAERRPAHGVTAATVPPLAVPCPQSFGVTGGEVAFAAGATGRRSAQPRGARQCRGAMGPHAAAAHTAAFVQAPGAATLPAPALRPRQLTANSRAKSGATGVFILLGLHLPAALTQRSVHPSLGCLTHTAPLCLLQSLSCCCPAHPTSPGRAQHRIHRRELLLALPRVGATLADDACGGGSQQGGTVPTSDRWLQLQKLFLFFRAFFFFSYNGSLPSCWCARMPAGAHLLLAPARQGDGRGLSVRTAWSCRVQL